jgi:zinc protease
VRLLVRAGVLLLAAAVPLADPVAGDAPAAAPPAPGFPVHHERLANGLEVILQPDPTVTSVVVHLRYHVGSKDEAPGQTGLAHLFEHLMFEGSRHVGEGQFDRLLEAAGGWNNGTTDTDATAYFAQIPAEHLELVLWLEADRMAGLWDAMNQGVLDNQRDVVHNERRDRYDNQPYGRAALAVQQALWPPGHGNHHPTIGARQDLAAATLADVEAFWRRWYRPSNATLVIVGGFEVEAARRLVARYFAWMPAQPPPRARGRDAPVTPRPRAVRLTARDRVRAAKLHLAWRTDAPYQDAAVDLAVAAQLLGGGKTSRLYRRLVFQDRLASEVDAYQHDQLLGGELHIEAIARQGVEPAALAAAIREELAALRATPPAADELERALRVLEASRLAGLENLASRASAIAEWAAFAGDPDHLAAELAQLRRVTPTSVQASAAAWLRDEARVEMTVLPEAARP